MCVMCEADEDPDCVGLFLLPVRRGPVVMKVYQKLYAGRNIFPMGDTGTLEVEALQSGEVERVLFTDPHGARALIPFDRRDVRYQHSTTH